MPVRDAERLAEEFRRTDPRELRADCPSAAQLWQAVAGELAPEKVRALVDHTASCVDCSIAWRVALEVLREDRGAPAAPVVPLRPRLPRSLLLPGGLTLVAAAIVAGLFFLGPWARHPSRSGTLALEEASERGAKRPLASLTAPGLHPKDAVVLRWSPYPGAERYSVTVMNSSLDILYRQFAVTTTELRIPPEAFSAQPAGSRALWSVQAILPAGRTVDSDVFTLDLP
jgi:hypothetical protein